MQNKNISEIDSNFAVKPISADNGVCWYNIEDKPFSIFGVFKENGCFRRMPEKIAETVSEGVYALHTNTAGGRVRFKTNSRFICIKADMPGIGKMPHFALTGSAGFDLYGNADGEKYVSSFVPPFNISNGYESRIETGDVGTAEYTVNFPLYSSVSRLLIGLEEGARLSAPEPYKTVLPVVYYGSSITQGGCASRPGNSYQSRVSRELGCDYINLGFSGNAKGERVIAEYISKLDMSAFVFDYDHNAPDPSHLRNTHKQFFEIIRSAKPELPIIIMSRPKYRLNSDEQERLTVIEETYNSAVAAGDKNVYLLRGSELMRIAEFDGTVDNCHPNDLGFYSMAAALTDLLEKII